MGLSSLDECLLMTTKEGLLELSLSSAWMTELLKSCVSSNCDYCELEVEGRLMECGL
eukprot:CAMPEP_0116904000 /NCGR_PEP_ID=MMETSP0467-20121206/11118_1 /TAXON_ID=283647 /ORGANISM="Mesodinium pulex, Strain SPMC105" /LENGTH=56 /DNA_ID=CAMNT_0004578481 /DNA_START=1034 /DNA_END=1204 /DNA_ORIENTATION=-